MSNVTVECITYGKGRVLKKELITPIKNYSWKPKGGLWSSPTNSTYQWKHWCMEEGHRVEELSNSFTFTFRGRLLQIRCVNDWVKLPVYKAPLNEWLPKSPDWEFIATLYDAVYVSSGVARSSSELEWNGEQFIPSIDIGGWGCSTLLVFNPNTIH
jgi:hypothetical protein